MKEMIKLAVPVVLAYLGQLAMQIVDMMAVGRIGPAALGGVALGSAFFYVFMVFGMGMLTGLDFLIAHAYGAGQREECRRIYVQSLFVTVFLSIPLTLIPWVLSYHLDLFGAAPDVALEAGPYLRLISSTMLPMFLFMATRQYMQATGEPRPAMVILVLANICNAFFNYTLVFGKLGFPRWETLGSGTATFISRAFTCTALFVVVAIWDKPLWDNLLQGIYKFDAALIKRLCKLGLPASLQMVLEVGAFSGATTLAARLSSVELSAHQIVLNTASLTFMVPLGISAATAVLIGQSLGRGDPQEAARNGWRGLGLGTAFMACSALTLYFFPNQILSIYSKDANVIAQGKTILLMAALFQVFDAVQVVGAGALRGVADTKTSMMANMAGHWLLGLPFGVYLCFVQSYGLRGLWAGLSFGLCSVASILLWRWIGEAKQLRRGVIPARVLNQPQEGFSHGH